MLEKGNRANTLHGILLIALFSFAAFYIAELPVVRRLSFSPLIVGIVLGMLYANSLRNKLPETWVPGIRFCTKQVLRWGIILYGFRLTLTEVAAVGIPAVAVDLIVVVVTILGGVLLGRLLKMDRDTALMTSEPLPCWAPSRSSGARATKPLSPSPRSSSSEPSRCSSTPSCTARACSTD